MRFSPPLALRVCLVVLASADVPQIRFPGLLAVRQVLLCGVVRLVGRDGGEVLRTRLDEATYLCEALTSHELVLRHRCSALIHLCVAYVDTCAFLAGRLGFAVRTDEVRATGVTVFLGRLRETTFHVLDTGCILYFSHSE